MFAKQLTVFIENRAGRLSEVLNVLKENEINILSLSLADTTEFGLLRLIVDNAALGKEKLTENGFSSLLSDISIINIPHNLTGFHYTRQHFQSTVTILLQVIKK